MSKPRRFDWLFRPQMADEDLPLSAEALFAEALAELPAVERSALALSEIGGLDTNEIAERLGTDPVVVRKLLARARESVRTSLALRGRRGLTAVLPFQSLWQVGSSAPVVRAAGVVAAAVVGPSLVIAGAGAEAPRAAVTPSQPLRVQAYERPERGALPVHVHVARAAAAVARTVAKEAVTAERRSVRPGAGRQRDRDAAVTTAAASPPRVEQEAPPVVRQRPAPQPLPPAEPEPVAVTVPLPVTPEPPLPLPVPLPPRPELPPVALPEPPPLPLP